MPLNLKRELETCSASLSYSISYEPTIQFRCRGSDGVVLLEVQTADTSKTDDSDMLFELLWHRRLDWTEKYKGRLVTVDWLRGFLEANRQLADRLASTDQTYSEVQTKLSMDIVEQSNVQSRVVSEVSEPTLRLDAEARDREMKALIARNEKILEENLSMGLQYTDERKGAVDHGLGLRKNRLWESPYYITDVYNGYRDKR